MLVFNNSNNFVVLAHSTTPSLQRKQILSNLWHFHLHYNYLFRFTRKTLGHDEEEERTETLEIIHKTKNGSDGDVTLLPSQRFFSQLERKEVEGLIQKYQIDLEMWGYSPQQYLKFAKNWILLLEGIWRVHLGHIWMPSLFKVGQLQYIWQSRKARILVLQKIKCQLGC